MELAIKLCTEYAKNRNKLNKINNEIDTVDCYGQNVCLEEYRKKYYDQTYDPEKDLSPVWEGWVTALCLIDGYTEKELRLATLLDKKKEIRKQAGIIKRRICAHGRRLLEAE